MDERKRRIVENEVIYRAVNEKISELNETFGIVAESMTVICECGVLECAEQIELDVVTYERVRADASLFVVLPGHEIPEVEHIVEEHDGFHIIRKDAGAAGALAVERDPRG